MGIKWIKELFKPTPEDEKLAKSIVKLFQTHEVTITENKWGGWSVRVWEKDKNDY